MLTGYIGNFCLALVLFTAIGVGLLFSLRDINDPLDYTNMASIYSSVEPMNVYFNNQVRAGSTQESMDFMESLSQAAGGTTI